MGIDILGIDIMGVDILGMDILALPHSHDIIAHIKGLSYLSDYRLIRASLGGAF